MCGESFPRARGIPANAPSRHSANPTCTATGGGRLRRLHVLGGEQHRAGLSLRGVEQLDYYLLFRWFVGRQIHLSSTDLAGAFKLQYLKSPQQNLFSPRPWTLEPKLERQMVLWEPVKLVSPGKPVS